MVGSRRAKKRGIETTRVVMKWKPEGKRRGCRPKKKLPDVIEEDFKTRRVQDWKGIVVRHREKWRDVVVIEAKNLYNGIIYYVRHSLRCNLIEKFIW